MCWRAEAMALNAHIRARVADLVPLAMIAIGAVGCAWRFVEEVWL